MNLDFSPEDIAFRDEVRAFIAENYPAGLRERQEEGELHKPRQTVMEPAQPVLVDEVGVSECHAADVSAHESVSVADFRQAVGEQDGRDPNDVI